MSAVRDRHAFGSMWVRLTNVSMSFRVVAFACAELSSVVVVTEPATLIRSYFLDETGKRIDAVALFFCCCSTTKYI